jgi:DNA end-binding protein Ku
VRTPSAAETELPKNAATNVVDFMSLLKKSIDAKQRTPAAERGSAKKTAAKKSAKSARKKPARKRAQKAS